MRSAVYEVQKAFVRDGFTPIRGVLEEELVAEMLNEFKLIGHRGGRQVFDQVNLERYFPIAHQVQSTARRFAMQLLGTETLPEILQSEAICTAARAEEQPDYRIERVDSMDIMPWNEMPFIQLSVCIPLVGVSRNHLGNVLYIPGAHLQMMRHMLKNWSTFSGALMGSSALAHLDSYASTLFQENARYEGCKSGDMFAMHGLMPHRNQRNDGASRPAWMFHFGLPKNPGKNFFTSIS